VTSPDFLFNNSLTARIFINLLINSFRNKFIMPADFGFKKNMAKVKDYLLKVYKGVVKILQDTTEEKGN
jgi:hypothetical protein